MRLTGEKEKNEQAKVNARALHHWHGLAQVGVFPPAWIVRPPAGQGRAAILGRALL